VLREWYQEIAIETRSRPVRLDGGKERVALQLCRVMLRADQEGAVECC